MKPETEKSIKETLDLVEQICIAHKMMYKDKAELCLLRGDDASYLFRQWQADMEEAVSAIEKTKELIFYDKEG